MAAAGGKATCLLVELAEDEETGEYRAVPIYGKSGLMTTLTRADGYVMIDTDHEGLSEGRRVKAVLF